VDAKDYAVELSADQLAQLRKTFPDGVCDNSKPGLGQQPSTPWMTFEDGPGGRPLGAAPRSRVSGGAALITTRTKSCASRRTFRLRVRRPRGARVRSLTVYVNGKRVKRVRGNRSRTTINLRGLPRGRVRVTVVVSAVRAGRAVKLRDRRVYRTCTAKKR